MQIYLICVFGKTASLKELSMFSSHIFTIFSLICLGLEWSTQEEFPGFIPKVKKNLQSFISNTKNGPRNQEYVSNFEDNSNKLVMDQIFQVNILSN